MARNKATLGALALDFRAACQVSVGSGDLAIGNVPVSGTT